MNLEAFEAVVTAALTHDVEIAECEHEEAKGFFDVTLARGGSRTRFRMSTLAREADVRVAVAQICDGLRPTEAPRRKVGGR